MFGLTHLVVMEKQEGESESRERSESTGQP
jgi:hypothetical protein